MEALLTLWGLSFLGMFGMLAYQGYLYLKLGEWVSFSATDVCARYMNVSWCGWPTDWLGLHLLLSKVNAAALVWLVLTAVSWAVLATEKR